MHRKEKEPQREKSISQKETEKKTNRAAEEVELLKSQLARTLADYDNLKKRFEREALELGTRIRGQFALDLIPALEMIYSVQKHLNDPGLAVSIKQFEDIFSGQGVVKIEPNEGEIFDENLHEAIDTVEGKDKAGQIAELISLGWKFEESENVINHAKVKVYR